MTRSYPLLLILFGVLATGLALYYQQMQSGYLIEAKNLYRALQGELKDLEEDAQFLKQNKDKLKFLISKGWFVPQSRLVGAEWIHQLKAVRLKIEPESIKEMAEGYRFKVSRVIVQTEALLDSHIYELSETILKDFPGILALRKLSVSRTPNCVTGELIFEWFVMEGKSDED